MSRGYYNDGADEIIFIDIVASLYGRNNLLDVVKNAAREVFIPMTVGGGIRTIDDINGVLRAGADKVAINTAAVSRPEFLREAAEVYGRQCIVLMVEAKKREGGWWEALTDNGREKTGRDVLEWVAEAEDLGAGEILITSVDQEGTRKGFDAPLMKEVRQRVDVPIIASGGAGSASHVIELTSSGEVDAVCCASLFHYDISSLQKLKRTMAEAGIQVRL